MPASRQRLTSMETISGVPAQRIPLLILPACEFPPDTPLENVDALADALFEYGYY